MLFAICKSMCYLSLLVALCKTGKEMPYFDKEETTRIARFSVTRTAHPCPASYGLVSFRPIYAVSDISCHVVFAMVATRPACSISHLLFERRENQHLLSDKRAVCTKSGHEPISW